MPSFCAVAKPPARSTSSPLLLLSLALLAVPAHAFRAPSSLLLPSLHANAPRLARLGGLAQARLRPARVGAVRMGGYGWVGDEAGVEGDKARVELWGSRGSRSPLVDWWLHELGVEWEDRGTAGNPNPFGSIPCLKDGAIVLFESGAILLYLADRFGALTSPRKKAEAFKWVTWANASLDPICFVETPQGQVYDTQLKAAPRPIAVLDKLLSSSGPYLSGDEFGVQDVAVASYLLFVPQFFPGIDLSKWPSVSRYMLECVRREAYGKAFGAETQAVLTRACEGYVAAGR